MAGTQKAKILAGIERIEGEIGYKEHYQLVINGELVLDSIQNRRLLQHIHQTGKAIAEKLHEIGVYDFEIIDGKKYESRKLANIDEFGQLELTALRVGIKSEGYIAV